MQPPSYPPAPRLLVLFNRLKRWNALPLPGGYMSQPAYLMLALDVVEDAVSERRKIEQINLRLQQEEIETGKTTQGLPGLKG